MTQERPSRIRKWSLRAAAAVATWVVLSSAVAVFVPNVPVGPVRESAADGMVVGAVHMHTLASDGSGTVDDLVDAALTNQLDFIVVTDHNTRQPTTYEYRRGVLIVHGEEFSSVYGHIVMLDMDTVRVSEADSLDQVHGLPYHRGPDDAGVRIAAHPNGRRLWRDRSASNVDGLEIWNADSEWRNDGVLDWIEALTLLPLRPSLAMLALVDRPTSNLALLDSAAVGRTLSTTCAVDAHARIDVTRSRLIRFPSYSQTLGLLHQHLPLTAPLTGEATVDGPRLVEAIRRGGGYCAVGGVADDGALQIEQDDDRIVVSIPSDVARARVRVYRDGHVVAEEEAHTVRVPTTESGMYRVEVDLRVRLVRSRWLPWIISAPIWVGPRPDDPPTYVIGRFEDDYGNRYTIAPDAWTQEPGVRYDVDWWYGSQHHVVARNSRENVADAGLWTRIDWLELKPSKEWEWAFCLSVWDAPTRAEARRSDLADRETPRTGCGGFPFSRMKRIE